MKLKKNLFDQLNAEMQEAQDRQLMAECAINALQELCNHEWKQEQNHGFPDDSPYCKICGFVKTTDDEKSGFELTTTAEMIKVFHGISEKLNEDTENRKGETFS